jgi:acyl-[acyl-carrier-protein]-phospholipid O-acyltransferase/long-chain-fatty-acid--[acyl-carrier-protein] ligase
MNLIVMCLRFIVKTIFRVEITGSFNQVIGKKTLFVANHTSLLDGLLTALFLPTKVTVLVHTSVLANPLFRFILRGIDHYAADPTNSMTFKSIIRMMNYSHQTLRRAHRLEGVW